MTADEPGRRGAEGSRRLYVVLLAHRDHLAPEHPHETRYEDDGDGDGRVVDAGTEQGGDGQRQYQWREREHGVHGPHDHGVHGAPEEAGDEPERGGDHDGDADDLEGGPHGDASAPDQPAQEVASQIVGPQPVQRRGSCVGDVQVLQVGRVGGDERGENGRYRDQEQKGQAAEGERLVQEPMPEARARRPELRPVGAVLSGSRGLAQPHEGILAGGGEGQAHTSRILGLR